MLLEAGSSAAVAVAVGGSVVHPVVTDKTHVFSLGAAVGNGSRCQILQRLLCCLDTTVGEQLTVLSRAVPAEAQDIDTGVGVGAVNENVHLRTVLHSLRRDLGRPFAPVAGCHLHRTPNL